MQTRSARGRRGPRRRRSATCSPSPASASRSSSSASTRPRCRAYSLTLHSCTHQSHTTVMHPRISHSSPQVTMCKQGFGILRQSSLHADPAQPIIEETVIQPIVERTRTYQVQQRTSVRPAMVRENVATAPKSMLCQIAHMLCQQRTSLG
jgi:hypothetical protein